ncbi:hypothetical protein GLGCALEP_00182 [Pseudomonas sp. MM221]|nr:hypothetical protein GLGCALEP_00182 [Pseudomonas sp. MM221]
MLEETAGRVDTNVGFPTEGLGFAAVLDSEEVGLLDTTSNNQVTTPPPDGNVATDLILGATPSISEAGGVIVYTATVGQAPTTNLVITLSNGAVIVISAGQTTGSVNVVVPANDTPYIDGGQISATPTGISGGGGLTVTLPQTPLVTQVTDTIDTTTATLTASPSVTEGGVITYTVTLSNPAQTPVTVTLSNGQVITIEAGKTQGSVDFKTPANDVYINGSTVSVTIEGATGGNFEQLTPNPAPAQTTINDSVDNTTATLTANPSVTEGGVITYTVTLSNPAQTLVTVTLSNGQTITVEAGKTQGSVDFHTPANDVYNNGSTVSVTIKGATGGNFEQLTPNPTPAQTTINDSVDNTTATLTANPSVTEGGVITYTVTLSNPAQTPVTVTLSNGQTITVEAGKTQGSVDFHTPANDVYNNGSTVNVTIENATGGNFEQLTPNPTPASTVINDSIDTVTVSIVSNGNVTEDQQPSFTVKVSQVLDRPLTVTLSNGDTVTIEAGKTEVEYKTAAQGDDVYKDAGSITLGVADATVPGATFEKLVLGGPATVEISDTISEVVAKLTATPSVTEGGEITYTITLTNKDGLPINNHSALYFKLTDGTTVVVPANSSTGSATVIAPDNVYVGTNPPVVNAIDAVSGADAWKFENLNLDKTEVKTQVTDEPGTPGNEGDIVKVTITADQESVAENVKPTFTVHVNQPLAHDLVVTLSNNAQVTIKAGETSASYQHAAQGDDVYKDAGEISLGIKSAADATGATFENLQLGGDASVKVTDTIDEVVAKLTATPSVTEGGEITYTITLTNKDGLPINNHSELYFKLTDGTTVVVPANSTTGSATVIAPDNVYVGTNPPVVNAIDAVSGADAWKFENLNLDKTEVKTQVTDEPGTPGNEGDIVKVTITADQVSVAENVKPTFTVHINTVLAHDLTVTLSNNAVVTIKAGQTSSEPYTHAAQGDDVYKDAGEISLGIKSAVDVTGAAFENLQLGDPASVKVTDTIDEVVAKLTATPSVTEGGEITYTITLTNKDGLPINNHSALYFKLTDGTTVVVPANSTTGSATVIAPDNVYVGTNPPVVNAIDAVSGADAWKFENLNLDKTEVKTQVTDEPGTPGNEGDIVKVTITADQVSVAENVKPTFTVHINTVLAHDLTVTLSNNAVVTIKAGQTSSEPYTHAAQGDDVYKDAGEISLGIKSAVDVTGAAFENLQLGDPASVKVTDTIDEVVAKLTATPSVTEGGEITYTITLTNKDGLPINNHSALYFKLTDGTTVVVPANSTTGSATVIAPDNVYVGTNPPVVNAIDSVSGADAWKFENLNLDKTEVKTQVTDEPGTPGNPGTPGVPNEGDLVQVSIVADQKSVLENKEPTFTIKLNAPLDHDLVVTLSNDAKVTIVAGQTSVQYTHAAQGDDVYKDGGVISLGIKSAVDVDGRGFENLQLGGDASVKVKDTVDDVVAKLTATPSVTEGGVITYTIELTNKDNLPLNNHGQLTFTLNDGTKIVVPANSTTGSITVTAPDNVYTGTNDAVVKSIASVTGAGKFEHLVLDQTPVSTTVTDEPGTPGNPGTPGTPNEGDLVQVSIVADQKSVLENKEPTFTIKLNAPLDHDLVVTLSNKDQVTIKAGDTSVQYTHAAQGDDVYKDGGEITLGLESAKDIDGRGFENLQLGGDASVKVKDTVDDVVAKLTATPSVTEGGVITYTIELTNKDNLPLNNHGQLTFTLNDGTKIVVPANSTTGSITVTAPDNVYTGTNDAVVKSIASVTGAGKFENLVLDQTPVSTTVTDEPGTPGNPGTPGTPNEGDLVQVSIVADQKSVLENKEPTFTIKLNAPLDHDLVVTLSNDAKVTIVAGETSVQYTHAAQGDDVYKDGGEISLGIKSAVDADGRGFENLQLGDDASVKVKDTVDDVVAKLTATPSVTEGGVITYTIELTNKDNLPLNNHGQLTFTLNDGTKIVVPANSTTGSITVTAPDNVYTGTNDAVVKSIASVTGAGKFESLVLDQTPVSTTVTDEPGTPGNPGTPGTPNEGDLVQVSIVADQKSVLENKEPTFTIKLNAPLDHDLVVTLSNKDQVTIKAGDTSVQYTHAAQGDDVYKDGGEITLGLESAKDIDGRGFENLQLGDDASVKVKDTVDDVVAKLTATSEVTEGGTITYTIELSNKAGLPMGDHGQLTFTLDDGKTKIIIPAGSTTGTVTVTAPDNVYTGTNDAVVKSIASVTGAGKFENLVLDQTPVSTTVTDEPGTPGNPGTPGTPNEGDLVQVSIVADQKSVLENKEPTFTIKLNAPLDHDLVVTLSNKDQVTIKAGDTSVQYTHAAQGDDVYKDGGEITLGLESAKDIDGRGFENLQLGGDASVKVKDTVDDVVAKLTATPSVTEGGVITYTIELTNKDNLPLNNHGQLTFTLNDGTKIVVPANSTTGSITVTAPDNVYTGTNDAVVKSIASVTGAGKFENLVLDQTPVSTTVTDEPGTPGNPGTPGTPNEGDLVQVSIVADQKSVLENKEPTFTIKLNAPLDHDLVVTLSNDAKVTIVAGETSVQYTHAAQGDDVYKDGGEISLGIKSAVDVDGRGFENLQLGDDASVKVKDTVDDVVAKLTATPSVTEGGVITYTIELTNKDNLPLNNHGQLTFTLNDGTKIVVPANSTTGSITVTAPDNVYTGTNDAVVKSIASVTGAGKFEHLVLDQTPVSTTVTDEPGTPGNPGTPGTPNEGDLVQVSIVADQKSVLENKEPTFTIKLNAPLDHDLVVTLSNKDQVTIKAGDTSVQYTHAAQGDDVYKDGGEITLGLESAKDIDGRGFENLQLGDDASVKVKDTVDDVVAKLTATPSVTEGGVITYTIELTNKDNLPLNNHGQLTFTLNDGTKIVVPANSTTGSITVTAPDNVYTGTNDAVVKSIASVTGAGKFEHLVLDQTPVSTTVTDEPGTPGNPGTPGTPNEGDLVQVSIVADQKSVLENKEPTFTIKLNAPLDHDLVVTLSNKDQVTIKAGDTSVQYTHAAQGDDVYKDGGEITLGLESAKDIDGRGFENLQLGGDASVKVKDTVDDVVAKLTATPSVTEGGVITYTIELTNKDNLPLNNHGQLTFTLDDGKTKIIIPAGSTTGTVTITAPDNVYTGTNDAVVKSIASVTGAGKFENLVLDQTPVSTTVTDEPGTPGNPGTPGTPNEGDLVQVSIVADQKSVLENKEPTFTIKLNAPLDHDLVVTLSNDAKVTIVAGETSVQYTYAAQGDDVYKDGGEISLGIKSAVDVDGRGFENLQLGDDASVKVKDTVDDVVAKLTATPSVTEGGVITYTIELTNKDNLPLNNHGQLTFTLNDGTKIVVPANSTTGSITVTAPDNVYTGTNDAVVKSIASVTGAGKFEHLVLDQTPVSTTVTDEPGTPGNPGTPGTPNEGDLVQVSIVADQKSVLENKEPTFTIKLNAPLDHDLVVTLSNDAKVTIVAGETSVQYTHAAQGDDVYKDGGEISLGIKSAVDVDGRGFENLQLGDDASVKVKDTVDDVVAKLTATSEVTEGGTITYTIELSNKAGLPMGDHGQLTFTLDDGKTKIIIPAGSTTGTVTITAPDNVYTGTNDAVVKSIASVTGAGKFENLVLDQTPVSTTVTDEPGTPGNPGTPGTPNEGDLVQVSIVADQKSVLENKEPTFTIKLNAPLDHDLVVTLSNDAKVTIVAGETSVQYTHAAQGDDVYKDGGEISLGIKSAVDVDGRGFENLQLGDDASVKVKDTVDDVVAKLTATSEVTEGGTITYTIELSNKAGLPMGDHGQLTFTLDDGKTKIIIPAGSTTGTVTITAPDNVYTGTNDAVVKSIASVTGAGKFENLVLDQTPVSTTVTDEPGTPGNPGTPGTPNEGDLVQVSIVADQKSVLENKEPTFTIKLNAPLDHDLVVTLSNKDQVTIKAGDTSVQYTHAAQGDDVYKDGGEITLGLESAKDIDGRGFENLQLGDDASVKVKDTVDDVVAKLTATSEVTEGGTITYTIELSNKAGLPMGDHGQLTFTLDDGKTKIIIPAGSTTGTVTVTAPDNVYTGTNDAVVKSIASVTGAGKFENLVLDQTPVSTTVTDEPGTPGNPGTPGTPNEGDLVQVSIVADQKSVLENKEPTFTIKLNAPLDHDLVVTLSNKDQVTIKAGDTSVQYTHAAQGDDVYKDGGEITLGLESAKDIDGRGFENLQLGGDASVKVKDTVDDVVAKLTATPSVTEGGVITYTIELTNKDNLPLNNHGQLTFTLDDGKTKIIIPAGSTTGTVTITAPDNVYTGTNDAVVKSIASVTGAGKFENLVLDQTPVSTTVTDEPGTPGNPGTPGTPNEGDLVQVSIVADQKSVLENKEPTFTIKLNAPLDHDLVVTLSNDAKVTIVAGETSVQYTHAAQGDDVYKDGGEISLGIKSAVDVDGRGFENLQLGDDASVKVKDTVDDVVAKLTATESVTEGGTITYTIELSNKAGLPMGDHGQLTFTLDDGKTKIIIPAGSTTGTVTITAPDNVYTGTNDAVVKSIASVTGAGKFENLVLDQTPVSTTVTDEPGTPGNPGTPGTPNEGDLVQVSIVADQKSVLENKEPTFTIKLNAPLDHDLVVTLSNDAKVTIVAGETSVQYTHAAQGDDVYKDGGEISLGIKSAVDVDGRGFENLQLGDDASVKVKDTVDDVVAKLTATESVTEGGTITYTIELSNKAGLPMGDHGQLTFTLDDGKTKIIIPAGSTTGTVTITAPDNVYTGTNDAVVKSIASVTGAGKFENLVLDQTPVSTTVTDEPGTPGNPGTPGTPNEGDLVQVSIVADQKSVLENEEPTFTVKINTKLDHDLIVTLSNDAKVTIVAGDTSAQYTHAAQGDDVFQDGGEISLGLKSAVDVDGRGFENLQLGDNASVEVTDTLSKVTAVLTVDSTSVVEGGKITYTVTLISEDTKLPVTGHGGVTVTLTGGTVVTIPAGSASGTGFVTAPNDLYAGGQPSITKSITGIEVTGSTKFENLVPDTKSVTTTVSDEPNGADNLVKVSITPVVNSVNEATAPSFTVTLNKPIDKPLTVKLSTGETLVFEAGQTTKTVSAPAQGDDVFIDKGQITVSIDTATVPGAPLENLVIGDPAVVQVTDTLSKVTAVLSVDSTAVVEGGKITYTVTLISEDTKLPVTGHGGVTVTLTGGTVVTIPAGSASGTGFVTAPNDLYAGGQPSITKSITGIEVTGSTKFENLVPDTKSVTTTVSDEPNGADNLVKVSITPVVNSVNEATAPSFTVTLNKPIDKPLTVKLSTGETLVFEAGQTTKTVSAPAQGDDVFIDKGQITVSIDTATVPGAPLENLVIGDPAVVQVTDTLSKVTAVLSVDSTAVVEGGKITYTVTLISEDTKLPVTGHGGVTVTLTGGTVVTIPAGSASGTGFITAPNDPYVGGQATITKSITGIDVTGSTKFENLVTDTKPVSTTVTDEPSGSGDVTKVGITGTTSLTEGETGQYSLTLSNASKAEVTITLSYSGTAKNGEDFNGVTTVKIPANSTGTTFNIATIDDKLVEGTENFVVKIETATGGNFENLQVDSSKASVTTNILDNDHLPVSPGGAVEGVEDTEYLFKWSDFKVTDADGNTGLFVTITSLPVDGSLKVYNSTTSTWSNVASGQVVSQADIDKGYLKFVPKLNESGIDGYGGAGVGNKQADYAQFKYKPNDGTNTGGEVTMKVDIAPQADKPTLSIGSADVVSKSLTKEVWTSLKGLGTDGNGITGDALKTVFANSGTATSTGTTTNVQSDGSVNAGSGSKTSGLIYLEEGKTYTFSGTADDSLVVTVGGNTVVTTTWGAEARFRVLSRPKPVATTRSRFTMPTRQVLVAMTSTSRWVRVLRLT